jgi:hypothetical protein
MQHHLGELATQQPKMALQITPARAQLGCASAFLSRRKPQNDLQAAPKDCLAAQHPAQEELVPFLFAPFPRPHFICTKISLNFWILIPFILKYLLLSIL